MIKSGVNSVQKPNHSFLCTLMLGHSTSMNVEVRYWRLWEAHGQADDLEVRH